MNRKEEIIYATLELAAEHGLRAVSMQMIADKVGIRKASVYNHYQSKEEIIETMYSFLRNQSIANTDAELDLSKISEGRSLREILSYVVDSYKKMSTSPKMYLFYKIIMSERTLDRSAAEIMVMETEKMIGATTALFNLLNAKGLAEYKNIDAAAYSFAMGINSIINYECDLMQIDGSSKYGSKMFIDEFCNNYEK